MDVFYQFFEEHELLIHKFVGEFSLEHYENYIGFATLKNIDVTKVKKMLTDLREILENPIPANIPHLVNELARIREKVKMKSQKNLFLISKPISAAIMNLYQELQKSKGFDYSICTTLTFAKRYLELNVTENELERMIQNLKYKY